jgi:Xaa-Pro aminopeptidase
MDLYNKRLSKLQAFLSEKGCDGLIIEDKINLYYLTGLSLSAGKLVIHPEGALLVVDSRYYEQSKKNSPFPVILAEGSQLLTTLFSSPDLSSLKCLAFNSDNTTYGAFLQLQKEIENINGAENLKLSLKPIDNPTSKLRIIKDPVEINTLREAAKLGSEGFDFVCSLLKEGITEAEIAVELEIFWKRKGGKTIAFDPIIAFGSNSSMPHYRVGNDKLQKGKSILIDIGVNFEHYHSDMTRVVYFGKPDPKLLAIHRIVQKAQQYALDNCKPHTLIGELDAAARNYITEQGYGENFTHSLGHGVGLEIHESPTIRNKPPYNEMPLQKGMVITIEPGIYLPGIGGVRIEDTVVITATGHENLTNRPKDPIIFD